MERKIYWATEERISEIIGVTPRRIRDVCKGAKNGDEESKYKRKYNLVVAIQLYLKNLQVEKMDYATEIKRLDKELKEHKLNVVQENYVEVKVVEKIFIETLMKVKMKLSNLAGELSSELMDKSNKTEIESIIKNEVSEILEQLSNFSFGKEKDEEE